MDSHSEDEKWGEQLAADEFGLRLLGPTSSRPPPPLLPPPILLYSPLQFHQPDPSHLRHMHLMKRQPPLLPPLLPIRHNNTSQSLEPLPDPGRILVRLRESDIVAVGDIEAAGEVFAVLVDYIELDAVD